MQYFSNAILFKCNTFQMQYFSNEIAKKYSIFKTYNIYIHKLMFLVYEL